MASPKVIAIVGLVLMGVGCVLGIVGMATSSWAVRPGSQFQVVGNVSEVVWTRGLWEECLVPVNAIGTVPCRLQPLALNLDATIWVMRIVILLGELLSLISFICVVIWLFGSKCRESYGWRTAVFLFSSFSAFLTIMTVLAYAMTIVTDKSAQFTLGWSFGLAIAGALLLGPGNFCLCHYAHHLDDKDNLLYEKHTRNQGDMGDFQFQHQQRISSSYM